MRIEEVYSDPVVSCVALLVVDEGAGWAGLVGYAYSGPVRLELAYDLAAIIDVIGISVPAAARRGLRVFPTTQSIRAVTCLPCSVGNRAVGE